MNSLEFIEIIIKRIKQLIKEQNKYIEDNQNYPSLLEFHIQEKENLEIDLTHFQQIKAELEAWYVVEKHLDYFPSDYYNGIPEEVITMTSKIDKKDYPIVKKALEVEENVD